MSRIVIFMLCTDLTAFSFNSDNFCAHFKLYARCLNAAKDYYYLFTYIDPSLMYVDVNRKVKTLPEEVTPPSDRTQNRRLVDAEFCI